MVLNVRWGVQQVGAVFCAAQALPHRARRVRRVIQQCLRKAGTECKK
jgi:hypothetical protein